MSFAKARLPGNRGLPERPPAVRATFAEIYREKTGEDAEVWLRGLESEGRYMMDVWSSG